MTLFYSDAILMHSALDSSMFFDLLVVTGLVDYINVYDSFLCTKVQLDEKHFVIHKTYQQLPCEPKSMLDVPKCTIYIGTLHMYNENYVFLLCENLFLNNILYRKT